MDGYGQSESGRPVLKMSKTMHYGAVEPDEDIPLSPSKKGKPSLTKSKAGASMQTRIVGTKGKKSTKNENESKEERNRLGPTQQLLRT